jgi:hypothetical protein
MGKDLEGKDHGVILLYYGSIRLEGLRKTTRVFEEIIHNIAHTSYIFHSFQL